MMINNLYQASTSDIIHPNHGQSHQPKNFTTTKGWIERLRYLAYRVIPHHYAISLGILAGLMWFHC